MTLYKTDPYVAHHCLRMCFKGVIYQIVNCVKTRQVNYFLPYNTYDSVQGRKENTCLPERELCWANTYIRPTQKGVCGSVSTRVSGWVSA